MSTGQAGDGRVYQEFEFEGEWAAACPYGWLRGKGEIGNGPRHM